jgi:hypothetical protein
LILRKCEPARERELRRIFEKEPFEELERLVTQKLLDAARMAEIGNRSYETCVPFLDDTIDSRDIDLETFGVEVVLNPGRLKRFDFAGREPQPSLSGDATGEEIEFLKALKFRGKQPSPIYYYRELQNLRDPLHFLPVPTP